LFEFLVSPPNDEDDSQVDVDDDDERAVEGDEGGEEDVGDVLVVVAARSIGAMPGGIRPARAEGEYIVSCLFALVSILHSLRTCFHLI